jgi:predicted dienelactone hydrolase
MKFVVCLLITMLGQVILSAADYDPLRVTHGRRGDSITLEVKDSKRERSLPIRVYLPATSSPAPVILFSHGLGGSRDNNPYLGNHWAGRGYVVVFVQHPGSDESVWKNAPQAERMAAMKAAASASNAIARTKDIPAVLDALAIWNKQDGHPLHGRLDMEHIGMSGHSFGAQTTQAMAGQTLLRGNVIARDKRIDAAVMMSPSPPLFGDPASAFSNISIPCLLMTGTLDKSIVSNTTPADRLKVFPHLEKAPAWQVVFDGANHMDFSERDGPLSNKMRNPRYHKAILALTTAFWDAVLRDNAAARAWLNGDGAKSVLIASDRWEKNTR